MRRKNAARRGVSSFSRKPHRVGRESSRSAGLRPRPPVIGDWQQRLLFREGGLVVVDKPAGWCSVGRDRDDPDCVQFALEGLVGRRLWAVHQLDRGTTGVNLFVAKKSLVAKWQGALKDGQKTYWALVHGAPSFSKETVDVPLGYSKAAGRPVVGAHGKCAQTGFRVLGKTAAHGCLEALPKTGRTHQIRVHAAHLGLPLIGEKLHRNPPCSLASGPLLHCRKIVAGGESFEANPSAEFVRVSGELGIPLTE